MHYCMLLMLANVVDNIVSNIIGWFSQPSNLANDRCWPIILKQRDEFLIIIDDDSGVLGKKSECS